VKNKYFKIKTLYTFFLVGFYSITLHRHLCCCFKSETFFITCFSFFCCKYRFICLRMNVFFGINPHVSHVFNCYWILVIIVAMRFSVSNIESRHFIISPFDTMFSKLNNNSLFIQSTLFHHPKFLLFGKTECFNT